MASAASAAPWETIRSGVIAPSAEPLSLRASLESPCDTCTTASCCTYLPLHTFNVATLMDVSYAGYLLNFDRIRLGLSSAGRWSVYYVEPCQFLDRATLRCTVHGRPQQPRICSHYNPYSCWYRPTLGAMATDDFVLIDRTRLGWLRERLAFDESRNLVGVPSFAETVAAFADLSDNEAAGDLPSADAAHDGWVEIVLTGRTVANEAVKEPANGVANDAASHEGASIRPYAGYEAVDRCDGCSAPCCDTLTFAQGAPSTVSSLDHIRFSLGFPGIELLIDDAQWWIVVKSRCQHFEAGRCGVYGQPERPLQCTFYDAAKCTYVDEFAKPRPDHAVRVRYDDFDAIAQGVAIDAEGRVVGIEPVVLLRERIERRWRETAATHA